MKTKQLLFNTFLLIGMVSLIFVGCDGDEITDINNYSYDGETVTDIDGNVYNTVTIGEQVWMAENLKTTRYNDDSAIPLIAGNDPWTVDTLGAYCNYDNDTENVATYGRLYNWYTVETEKLCPTGWHVPSPDELNDLEAYIKSDSIYLSDSVATVLKAPYLWANNGEGSDDYQFRALPGGSRSSFNGEFNDLESFGFWWTTEGGVKYEYTEIDTTSFNVGTYVTMNSYSEEVQQVTYKSSLGLSVRCIKD